MRTITVRYSCPQCQTVNAPVEVPARENDEPPEMVVPWVRDVVAGSVGAHHKKRSPHCRATSMKNLMIPILDQERYPNLGIGMLPPEESDATADPRA